jgi:ABC-type branched-subunit amino acid transport system ATPase component
MTELLQGQDVVSSESDVVQARNVDVRFGGVRALDDVSLSVGRREIHGLIGPNGAGKSTLVKVISGAERQGQDSVSIFGRPMHGVSAQRRTRLGLASTFQNPALFGSLTVRENLELARSRAPKADADRNSWIDSLPQQVGLDRWLDLRAGDVPYPVQKLVDVVRAMSLSPLLLLVDEPAGGLNSGERELLADLLLLARDHLECSIILIEHDVPLVFRVCERITVLSNGQVIAGSMTPEETRNHPEVISAYLGTPV